MILVIQFTRQIKQDLQFHSVWINAPSESPCKPPAIDFHLFFQYFDLVMVIVFKECRYVRVIVTVQNVFVFQCFLTLIFLVPLLIQKTQSSLLALYSV